MEFLIFQEPLLPNRELAKYTRTWQLSKVHFHKNETFDIILLFLIFVLFRAIESS